MPLLSDLFHTCAMGVFVCVCVFLGDSGGGVFLTGIMSEGQGRGVIKSTFIDTITYIDRVNWNHVPLLQLLSSASFKLSGVNYRGATSPEEGKTYDVERPGTSSELRNITDVLFYDLSAKRKRFWGIFT